MLYILLGIVLVICILLLSTLAKSKKVDLSGSRREQERRGPVRDVGSVPQEKRAPQMPQFPQSLPERAVENEVKPVPELLPAAAIPAPVAEKEETSASTDCAMSGVEFAEKFLQKSFMDNALQEEFNRCKGQFVSWQGKLRGAYSFRSDFIFGNRPGTRATIHLCDISDQYGMRSSVTCIAAFDAADEEKLRNASGKEITFRARIVRVNSTIREIVLDEAELR